MPSTNESSASCRILHLEDSPDDAFLIRRALQRAGLAPEITLAENGEKFHAALKGSSFDLIISDSSVPGLSSLSALFAARARFPNIPFLCVSSAPDDLTRFALNAAGISDYLGKDNPDRVATVVRDTLARTRPNNPTPMPPTASTSSSPVVAPLILPAAGLSRETARLVQAIQQLSLARSVEAIREIVRHAARELTGADGATFVLRDGDKCYYVDEDSIAPLWKGQRFPMSTCISGWAMLNRRHAAIEDIYVDPRIPHDAYRPTFVKSLVMVPIRTASPVGAIGNYWARRHAPTSHEIELLQALADSTSVAMENVQVYSELEQRVRDRTHELQIANRELEAFSYSVSHDLRAPLNVITGYAQLLVEDYSDKVDATFRHYIDRTRSECTRMRDLIEDLLRLAQISRLELRRSPVDLTQLANSILDQLRTTQPTRVVEVNIEPGLTADADPGLLRAALENLLSNAWKYTGKTAAPSIAMGRAAQPDGTVAFFIRDNGAGFDPAEAERLFAPFQRLHPATEFPGTGVGLATVQRIILKHGGRIWAEARPGAGATFYFTLVGAA